MNKNIPDGAEHDEALPTQQMPEDLLFDQASTNELHLISFYLPSRTQPIVSKEATITLGRRDPKQDITPTIDLTEERGAQLGVSRLHAEVIFQNGRYFVKDLGSSNGSWVNNTKLVAYQPQALNTGDQIRLGQLNILVHITLPLRDDRVSTASQLMSKLTDADYSFRLITHSKISLIQTQGGFSPILLETITKTLLNIQKIHTLIRAAQGQEHEGFSVLRIRTEAMERAILIDTKGATDVLDFLINKMDDFVKVLEKGGNVELTPKMAAAVQAANVDHYENIPEQVAEYALQELVFRFLNETRKDYVQKLATHLGDLIDSTLDIVSAD